MSFVQELQRLSPWAMTVSPCSWLGSNAETLSKPCGRLFPPFQSCPTCVLCAQTCSSLVFCRMACALCVLWVAPVCAQDNRDAHTQHLQFDVAAASQTPAIRVCCRLVWRKQRFERLLRMMVLWNVEQCHTLETSEKCHRAACLQCYAVCGPKCTGRRSVAL